jgi:hypothetical protein
LEETNRLAAPSAADRERITEALRARLGAVVLPEGFVPAAGGAVAGSSAVPAARVNGSGNAARVGLGRGGWLSVVVGTGVVAGALGFVLGHRVAERERGAPIDGAEAVATASARAAVLEPASSGATPTGAERSGPSAPGESDAMTPEAAAQAEASSSRPLAPTRAAPVGRRAPLERAGRSAASAPRGSPEPEARRLSFAEVLERVQRANVALRQGQPALALIQLEALDRGAGEVLREEREATRVLALCAIGDTAGARRVAAPLLSGSASSIYAPRLDASCVRDEGVKR